MKEVIEKKTSDIRLNRVEEAISSVSPRWGARRLANKAALEANKIQLSYGAAYPSIYRTQAIGPLTSEEAELQGYSRFQLMLDSRDLYRNFPIIRAAVNGIASRTVASGIHPEFNTENEDWNEECLKQWLSWCDVCDLAGKFDMDGVCRQAIRSCYTDGDLGIGLVDSEGDLRLQLIEGDRIAENQRAGIQIDTINPIGGINVDWNTGRVISYLVGRRGMGGILNTDMFDAWPAASFIMFFREQRVDQVRGVPLLAPVIQTARDLDRYITATRIQANIAATFGVVIKRSGAAQLMMNESKAVMGSNTTRLQNLTTGKFVYLNPGEEIDTFEPKIPGAGFDDFSKFLVRLLAVGIGTTYEAIMNDFTNMSFSSSKTHLMDIEMMRKEWQRELIRKVLGRIYSIWVAKRMQSRRLDFNPEAFEKVSWVGPRAFYMSPSDEASSTNLRLQAGTLTYQDEFRQQEANWKNKLRDRAEAQAYIDKLAEEYDVTPESIAFAGVPGMNTENENGKEVDEDKKSYRESGSDYKAQ